MTVRAFLAEIRRRDRVLALAGWLHVGLLLAMVCAAPFDSRTVLGLNPWIKPIKFAVSSAAYLWTLAWFMAYLPGPRALLGTIRWGVSIAMVAETACIALQGARGTTSHYNIATAFDGAVFSLMGIMIVVNTLLAFLVLVLFFLRTVPLAPAYLWGLRLGMLLFVLGSVEGSIMILHGAHTVGAPDGGPGLPFVNWSSAAGDLRIAHLLGLHSIQVLPLVGYGVSRYGRELSRAGQVASVFAFALIYFVVAVALFRQAMAGRTLFGAGGGA